jgi:hypothetical protein
MTRKIRKSSNKISLPRSVRKLFPKVTAAYDAKAAIDVSVEDKDCKSGKKLDPSECALARAAKREFSADGVIIGMSTSYIIKGKEAIRFQTPESVSREIVSFDRSGDFAIGNYHLPPKSPTARFGGEKNKRANHGTNKGAKRRVHHTSARVRVLDRGRSKE